MFFHPPTDYEPAPHMSFHNHALNSYNYTINFTKMVVFCLFY